MKIPYCPQKLVTLNSCYLIIAGTMLFAACTKTSSHVQDDTAGPATEAADFDISHELPTADGSVLLWAESVAAPPIVGKPGRRVTISVNTINRTANTNHLEYFILNYSDNTLTSLIHEVTQSQLDPFVDQVNDDAPEADSAVKIVTADLGSLLISASDGTADAKSLQTALGQSVVQLQSQLSTFPADDHITQFSSELGRLNVRLSAITLQAPTTSDGFMREFAAVSVQIKGPSFQEAIKSLPPKGIEYVQVSRGGPAPGTFIDVDSNSVTFHRTSNSTVNEPAKSFTSRITASETGQIDAYESLWKTGYVMPERVERTLQSEDGYFVPRPTANTWSSGNLKNALIRADRYAYEPLINYFGALEAFEVLYSAKESLQSLADRAASAASADDGADATRTGDAADSSQSDADKAQSSSDARGASGAR